MATATWKTAREEGWGTADILRRFDMLHAPIDIEGLLKRMGIGVHRVSNPGWSGACRTNEHSANVWVNSDHAMVRQRFTLAHELGHVLLHPLGEEFRDDTFAGGPREIQANKFAAQILMPAALIKQLGPLANFRTDVLADTFQVSEQAMGYRLLKFAP